jgi:hypothetical protein
VSGVAIIRELLARDPAVVVMVPADRIVAGLLKQGSPIPALTAHQVGDTEAETTARNLSLRMMRERVQVTALAKDWVTMKKIIKAASLGGGVYTGTVLGFKVCSVLPLGANGEIPPGEDGIYEQSRDFMVTFLEAN